MNARTEIVQSVFDFAMREINALEQRIVTAEDDADAMLWEQAAQVVAQLKSKTNPHGLTQRQLAAQWINARTGEPYGHTHVCHVKQVFGLYTNQPRPRFRDAYNAIANAAPPSTPHVSQNTGNNEWYTPQDYIDAARAVLGEIDLDPASSAAANAVIQAKKFYTSDQDGLKQTWRGRVWMNPPYSQPEIERFTSKFAKAVRDARITAGIVLVNNATETDWFRTLGDVATAVCFPKGRVRFWSPDRASATPLQGQALIYVGDRRAAFQEAFSAFGVVLVKPDLEMPV